MARDNITASVSGTFLEIKELPEETLINLSGSSCALPVSAQPNVLSALRGAGKGENIHLAGYRTNDRFIAESVISQKQARKYAGEVVRVLKRGTLRIALTDGRGCTSVPSTVRARQTSEPLRPRDKVCVVGFEIEPATASARRNPDRVFLDAFYVRKTR